MSSWAKKTAAGSSRPQTDSYHGRHLQKHSLAQGYSDKSNDTASKKWRGSEIAQRGEKIIGLMGRK